MASLSSSDDDDNFYSNTVSKYKKSIALSQVSIAESIKQILGENFCDSAENKRLANRRRVGKVTEISDDEDNEIQYVSSSEKSIQESIKNCVSNQENNDCISIGSESEESPAVPITRRRRVRQRHGRWQSRKRNTVDAKINVIDLEELPTNDSIENFENFDIDSSPIQMKPQEIEDINVKVLWRSSKCHKFLMSKYAKLTKVFEFFADLENVSIGQVLLRLHDTAVSPQHTPDSIGLTIVDILEGGIVKKTLSGAVETAAISKICVDKNAIEVKVQRNDSKKPMMFSIKKTQPMSVLVAKVAVTLDLAKENIHLQFDGEDLDIDETPETLELEGGECFDLRVSAKEVLA